jgi:hypothetical protein
LQAGTIVARLHHRTVWFHKKDWWVRLASPPISATVGIVLGRKMRWTNICTLVQVGGIGWRTSSTDTSFMSWLLKHILA